MTQLYSQSYDAPWGYGEEAVTFVPPLVAQGVIENYTFPSSSDVGVQDSWSIVAHNIGSDGRFAAGIVNVAGNPGDMTIIWMGEETIIPPNTYFRINSVNPEPNCKRINVNGGVKFAVAGNYTIKLWALHEGTPNQWIYDDERIVTVNVSGVTPPDWPYTAPPIHLFNHVLLKAGVWEIRKYLREPIIDIDTSLLVGARLDYTVKYTDGSVHEEGAWIDLDDNQILFTALNKGEAKSGVIDLTGKIGKTATFTIKVESGLGNWSEVMYDVWLTLGFSEEPPIPPGPAPFDWWEWLRDNAWWMALGTVGLGAVFLFSTRRPAPPVIIYQAPGKGGK
ncbi:hypothetical protein ES703_52774 [subsurface metagenome]